MNSIPDSSDLTIDATGLACPMPLLKAKQGLNQLQSGQVLQVLATDPGSERDIPAFCKISGHRLLALQNDGRRFCYWLQKR